MSCLEKAARTRILERTVPSGNSVHPEWTIPWLAERWIPVCASDPDCGCAVNFILDRESESDDLAYAWRDGIGKRWFPEPSANFAVPHDFSEDCGTTAYVCTSIFADAGMAAEDVKRLLDGHGHARSWQQWKVLNHILSLVFVSTTAYSLALSRWKGRECPFPLGNFIPRSIIQPFRRGDGCAGKHVVLDEDGSARHYASHRTTFGFVRKSEEMPPARRWETGNFCADYVRVAEWIPNQPVASWVRNAEEDSWILKQTWKSMPSYYYATAKMEALVTDARAGRAKFIPIDCRRISEWYWNCYTDPESGELQKSKNRMLNARREFPSIWKRWTGVRLSGSSGQPEIRCKNFAQAMKVSAEEIASGSRTYVTHIEKIVRGMLLGEDAGSSLQDLMEKRTPNALMSAMKARKAPKRIPVPMDGGIIENDVFFDWEWLFSFLECSPKVRELTALQIRQLELMAEEGWINESGIGVYRPKYRRSLHGRYYGSGNAVQMLPKWLRKELFGKYYVEADLGSAVVSIISNQAAAAGYGGDLGELEEMVADKEAYRESLAAEDCGISRDRVKQMITMIGYGCKCSSKRLMTEAEWCCLVDQYDIEETEYDILSTRSRSALFRGVEDSKEKMAIALWTETDKVSSYCAQMKNAGTFVIGMNTVKLNGRSVVRNAWGTELVVPKGSRLSFGKKLAHIYQGAESKLLWTIWDKFEVEGRRLRDIEGGFGLFIHDGFGIRKDIAEKLGDPAKALRDFAKKEFGWDLKYSVE